MNILKLYDLAGEEPERRFSPYCWRVRMALAHKGLAAETIAWRFADKAAIAPSEQGAVPVLVDGDRWISDSWRIAEYLEDSYPERPSLFGGGAGRALSRFHSSFADALAGAMVPILILDIHARLAPVDRDYFRTSREARFGKTLEQVGAEADARIPLVRERLAPVRTLLKAQPFLGGDVPLYADYALFGLFQWARAISPAQILAADDPVAGWRERMLDLFDGLARGAPGYD